MSVLKHKGSKKIKTDRLILRKVRISDYKDMFAYVCKEEVAEFVSWTPHKDPKETKKLCKSWRKRDLKKCNYHWCIVFEDKVIGNIDVVYHDEKTAILGWQLDNVYWNKGIITEAATAVRDYLLYEVGFETLEACYIDKNIGSGRVMQKIGMTEIPCYESLHYKIKKETEMKGNKLIFYKLNK